MREYTMAPEAYVSLKVAKLLKEKGFNQQCMAFYDYQKALDKDDCDGYVLTFSSESCEFESIYITNTILTEYQIEYCTNRFLYSVPTHQMAMRWLREKYNIHISIQPDFPSDKDYKMCWWWCVSTLHEKCISMKGYQCYLETYEEAVEAALKYTLENIIKDKENDNK